jgi:hypothetical protein
MGCGTSKKQQGKTSSDLRHYAQAYNNLRTSSEAHDLPPNLLQEMGKAGLERK